MRSLTYLFFLANPGQKSFNDRRTEKSAAPGRGPSASSREAAVRLSKHKIEYLSGKVLRMIQEHPEVHILSNTDLVERAAYDAIWENLEIEQEIDDEVEELLSQNYNEIRAMEMDVGALRNKMKRELARKKNFVL